MNKALYALPLLLGSTGCAFIRNIPANSTPLREARYYRTQDLENFAGGFGVDIGLRLVFPGPTRCGQPGSGDYRKGNSILFRLGTVTAIAVGRRQFDRGYREGGALFDVTGALFGEIVSNAINLSKKPTRPC